MAEIESIEALFDKLPDEDQAHVKRLFYGGTGTHRLPLLPNAHEALLSTIAYRKWHDAH
jgi:hypothetical protein